MAMFPPRPPTNFPIRSEPTSRYFQPQERSFFAQPGKEIVRVHVEVDLPHRGTDSLSEAQQNGLTKSRAIRDPASLRSWPAGHSPASSAMSVINSHPTHSPTLHPSSNSSASQSQAPNYSHSNSLSSTTRSSQRGGVTSLISAPLFPQMPPHPGPSSSQPPPNLHPVSMQHHGAGLRTPPPSSAGTPSTKTEQTEDYRDDPDEAWRTPMPYAERRRAGKHTRRVIVRN